MWIFFFLIMLGLAHNPFVGEELVPGVISNIPNGENVFTVRLTFGDPRREGRFLVDFNSSTLVMSAIPAASPPMLPIRIASSTILMDYVVDYTTAAIRGCPACEGVLPMGSGSPVWFLYTHTTVTSSGIRFSNYIHKKPEIQCIVPRSEFCTARGKVYGTEMDIHFVPDGESIVVPPSVMREYRHRKAEKGWWTEFVIEFGDEELVIPSYIMYDQPVGERGRLNMKMHEDGHDYVVLGNSVLNAVQIYKNANEHKIAFRSWPVYKNYSPFALLIVAVLYTLFFRSMETPPIYVINNDIIEENPFIVIFNMFLEGVVILCPTFVFFFTSAHTIIFNPVYMGVILSVMVVYYLLIGALMQTMFWANGVTSIGFLTNINKSSYFEDFRKGGYARLRIAREIVFETSVLLCIFIVSFSMRQDSYASYLAFATYLWFLVSITGNTVACFVATSIGFNITWLVFVSITTTVNITFWMVLVGEVCFPMVNVFIPRGGMEIVFYVVITHFVFIAVTMRKYLVKTRLMMEYIEYKIPEIE